MAKPKTAPRPQAFDVVMLRNGVNEATATRKDFRRVTVMATDPLEALQTVTEYHGMFAVKRRPKRRIQTWQILARKQEHGKGLSGGGKSRKPRRASLSERIRRKLQRIVKQARKELASPSRLRRKQLPAPKPVETCLLVKPDKRDPYAELLATLPELAPNTSPYDAMEGTLSPATIVELAGTVEMEAILLTEPSRSFLPGTEKHLAKVVLPLRNEDDPEKV